MSWKFSIPYAFRSKVATKILAGNGYNFTDVNHGVISGLSGLAIPLCGISDNAESGFISSDLHGFYAIHIFMIKESVVS